MDGVRVDRLKRLERMIDLSIAETGQACVPMGAIYATCDKHPKPKHRAWLAQSRIDVMALLNGWDVHQYEGKAYVWFTKRSDKIPQRPVDYRAILPDSQCPQCDLFIVP